MQKTQFGSVSTISGMVHDFTQIEQKVAELRLILACVAYQQDDKTLVVPVAALTEMPKGMQLDVTFDRTLDAYIFVAHEPIVTD